MTQSALRVAGAVIVAIAAFWAGLRVYSTHPARTHRVSIKVPAGEASAPTLTDLATSFEAAHPSVVKIPEHLPDFSLPDRDGKAMSIRTWEGKSLIINFWATWCAPCRREIPLLKTLHSEWAGSGVTVVGIAVDHRDPVIAYADELKIPYPLLIGEQGALNVAAAFGFDSPVFPFSVFTDRRGEVVVLFVGELHKAEADLILSMVEALNRNQIALPDARRSIAEGLHALAAASHG